MTTTQHQKPPQQKRSAEKRLRILKATEQLLDKKDFPDISVQDIVKAANTSVGVFYARFADKEAVLDALYEHHQEETVTRLQALDPEHWAGTPLHDIIRQRIHELVAYHRRHRGLLRALVLRGYQQTNWRYEDPKEREKLSVARFARLVQHRSEELSHPDPRTAARLSYVMLLATLREKMLFGHSTASALRISDKKLERELTHAMLAYLGVQQS